MAEWRDWHLFGYRAMGCSVGDRVTPEPVENAYVIEYDEQALHEMDIDF
jgi:hypothetical protein